LYHLNPVSHYLFALLLLGKCCNKTTFDNIKRIIAINNVPSEPQYPVLEALVRWSVHNEDSLISKLLENSKRWVTQKHHVAAEGNKEHSINKEDQVFFSYLNYNSKDKWHNANKALRDYENRAIAKTLLASYIIKSLSLLEPKNFFVPS
jgi:hypothetical protein